MVFSDVYQIASHWAFILQPATYKGHFKGIALEANATHAVYEGVPTVFEHLYFDFNTEHNVLINFYIATTN